MAGRGERSATGLHSCTTCAVSYTTRSNLERHVRERHAGAQHVCERCGATFTRRHRLEAHVRTHAGREPFQCSLCPATAASRSGLARHVQCHAAAGGGTACPDCGQVFRHYWRMKLHRRHHRAPRHGCRLCGRLFRHNRHLTDHLLAEHAPPPVPELPPDPDILLGLPSGLGPIQEPKLDFDGSGLADLDLDPRLVQDLPLELDPVPELPPELELPSGAEPPELELELDSAELGGELGAELAQLLGDGVRMELQHDAADDEAVMVITLVDE